MSYGQNAPWGLQAVRTQTDASWNGKLTPYYIDPTYANNIFKGDLVYISTTSTPGCIRNYGELSAAQQATVCPIGVFDGCEFQVNNAPSNMDPGNPGRACWLGSTYAGNANISGIKGSPMPIGYVINDPQVVFNAQLAASALPLDNSLQFSLAGQFLSPVYQLAAGIVQGNVQTGMSLMSVTVTNNPFEFAPVTTNGILFVDAISRNPNNYVGGNFMNVEVVIAQHMLRVFAPVVATPV